MDPLYALSVQQQIDKLCACTCSDIERATTQKRIAWCEQHQLASGSHPSPRQAFETLFFEYMGLSPEDLPVISESEDEIIWRSINPCPTLDACIQLGKDTRVVCRAAYEKSTQAFLSKMDPQLRFFRSYQTIRPYADHCLERIVRIDFEAGMEIAIEEAQQSRREGNKGYGAVILMGQQMLARAHDTASTTKDPSQHAEVNAIRQAVQVLQDANLSGAVLISSCEPCPMCASLAVWANLTSIVYGASIAETAQLGKTRILISAEEVAKKSPIQLEVIGGILQERCLNLYR